MVEVIEVVKDIRSQTRPVTAVYAKLFYYGQRTVTLHEAENAKAASQCVFEYQSFFLIWSEVTISTFQSAVRDTLNVNKLRISREIPLRGMLASDYRDRALFSYHCFLFSTRITGNSPNIVRYVIEVTYLK